MWLKIIFALSFNSLVLCEISGFQSMIRSFGNTFSSKRDSRCKF